MSEITPASAVTRQTIREECHHHVMSLLARGYPNASEEVLTQELSRLQPLTEAVRADNAPRLFKAVLDLLLDPRFQGGEPHLRHLRTCYWVATLNAVEVGSPTELPSESRP